MGSISGFTPASNAVDSAESSSSSDQTPIWIGVAIAVAVAIADAWNFYRSTTQCAAAFDAMMNTSARIQALGPCPRRPDLLAVSLQTYQLGTEPTRLTVSPLTEKPKSDLDRVRVLTAGQPAQLHRLDQIDSQLSKFNRQYGELTNIRHRDIHQDDVVLLVIK